MSDEVYRCEDFQCQCGFKARDKSDGLFEAVLFLGAERPNIFADFVSAFVLHCERLERGRAHLLKTLYE